MEEEEGFLEKEESKMKLHPINEGMSFRKFICELIGTLSLTFVACGVAVISRVDLITTSLSFGFVLTIMTYSIGNVSGCHINPIISLAFYILKGLTIEELIGYIIAQFSGGLIGSFLLGLCNRLQFKSLASNTIQTYLYKDYKDLDFMSYFDAILIEMFLSFFFVLAVLGVNDKRFHDRKDAGIVAGIALTVVNACGINFTGASINPARSLGPAVVEAIFGNVVAIKQIWVFFLGPILGGAMAGGFYFILI